MSYTQGELRTYVPEAGGNRRKPLEQQVEVEVRSPTESTKRKIQKLMAVGAGELVGVLVQSQAGTVEHETALDAMTQKLLDSSDWQEGVIRLCVTGVRLRTGGVWEHRGKAIKTAAEFAEFAPTAFVTEVAAEIYSEYSLTELEKKASSEPSDSSLKTAAPSTGTADGVAPMGSTSSEAATAAAPAAQAGSS